MKQYQTKLMKLEDENSALLNQVKENQKLKSDLIDTKGLLKENKMLKVSVFPNINEQTTKLVWYSRTYSSFKDVFMGLIKITAIQLFLRNFIFLHISHALFVLISMY